MDWEKIIGIILAVVLLIWLLPHAKRILAESQQAESDWKAVVLPLLAVIGFVFFLVAVT